MNRYRLAEARRTPHQMRPGVAHGGIIAALTDDMLGALQPPDEGRGPTTHRR